jgi:hypothetical protein
MGQHSKYFSDFYLLFLFFKKLLLKWLTMHYISITTLHKVAQKTKYTLPLLETTSNLEAVYTKAGLIYSIEQSIPMTGHFPSPNPHLPHSER